MPLLLGPTAVEDDADEVVADERTVEVFEHIGIDIAERAAGTVLVAIGKSLQYATFEVGSGVGRVTRIFGAAICGVASG